MNSLAQNGPAGKSSAAVAFGDYLDPGLSRSGDAFQRFWQLGYHRLLPVIPPSAMIRSAGKRPGLNDGAGWFGLSAAKFDAVPADLDRWAKMGAGVGIRCDTGVVAADIDCRSAEHVVIIREIAHRTLGPARVRIGNSPKELLPYRGSEPMAYRQFRFDDGVDPQRPGLVEFLAGETKWFVADGIHPTTMQPYSWPQGVPAFDDLTIVTPAQVEAFFLELANDLPGWRGGSSSVDREKVDQAGLVGTPDRVRRAIEALPNDPAIFGYNEWLKIGVALRGALPDDEALALELFEDWTEKSQIAEETENAARVFFSVDPPFAVGADYLASLAVKHSGGIFTDAERWFMTEDEIALSNAAEAANGNNVVELFPSNGDDADEKPVRKPIKATPYSFVDPSTLSLRAWIYGDHFIRKFVSVTAAPSKMGKSSLAIAEALAMASGKPLLGVQPQGLFRVWYWNGEDPFDELQKRVEATRQHYGLTAEDIGDRFFLDSGRQTSIVLAQQSRDGPTVALPIAAEVVATIRGNEIDVSIVDPFVSTHRVSENDNGAIDAVAKTWGSIADATNSAIELVHHVRKTNDAEVTIEDTRGAVSLIAASRSARVLTRMSKDDAKRFGLEETRRSIFRFNEPTSNLAAAPAESEARWMRLIGVNLANGPGSGPERIVGGDAVGVVTTYTPPALVNVVAGDEEDRILAAVAAGRWRKDPQAKDAWVGVPIAQALGVDRDDPAERTRVRSILAGLLKAGRLREVNGFDDHRKQKVFVEVAPRAQLSGVFD